MRLFYDGFGEVYKTNKKNVQKNVILKGNGLPVKTNPLVKCVQALTNRLSILFG